MKRGGKGCKADKLLRRKKNEPRAPIQVPRVWELPGRHLALPKIIFLFIKHRGGDKLDPSFQERTGKGHWGRFTEGK